MKSFALILLSFVPLVLCLTDDESKEWLRLLNLPKPVVSQMSNVCQLTEQSVTDFVAKNQNNGLVLIIRSSSQQNSGNDFAQSSAQLLASRNITVCEMSISGQTASPFGTEGSVVVVMNGKQHTYYGRKSAAALLSFVLKLNTSHIRLITGKLDKMAYDLVAGPKLVGFFMPGLVATPDMIAYETVAHKYSPNIPFYLVVDRMVAKHLKLSIVGQINLVKPFEKVAVTCPVNPATAQDIEAFIEQNKGVVLKYVTEENLFDPQLQNPNKTTLIAISDRTSVVGHYFHKLLTRTVRNITRENNATLTLLADPLLQAEVTDPLAPEAAVPSIVNLDSIEILWIDHQVFPSINVYLDQIQSQYGLAAGLDVYLGAVHTKNNQSVWLNTNLVNTTADKTADEINMQLLKNWITEIINNQTVVDTITTTISATEGSNVQRFVKEPQSVSVEENSGFVLECEVSGQVGDCLWLKDGQNIGFNLARVSPDYKWRQNTPLGDCSLVVSSAQPDRDEGEWVCEVTGDANNPTITSSPAVVTVTVLGKTEL